MDLRQGVLKSLALDDHKGSTLPRPQTENDADDELIYVVSSPGTPSRSRASSRSASRPVSPRSRLRSGLTLSPSTRPISRDLLKAFPTQVSLQIFRWLDISDLAACSRVSRKWNKSQTINYIWFQHFRKENFHDKALPPGKWTRRESKDNWRLAYLRMVSSTRRASSQPHSRGSPSRDGYQTPKERNEERWRQDEAQGPSKTELREMYKELGGRKARSKLKLGSEGYRDKTGWDNDEW